MELTGWEIGYLRRLILSKKTNEKSLNETDEILLDKLQDEKVKMIVKTHEYFKNLKNESYKP